MLVCLGSQRLLFCELLWCLNNPFCGAIFFISIMDQYFLYIKTAAPRKKITRDSYIMKEGKKTIILHPSLHPRPLQCDFTISVTKRGRIDFYSPWIWTGLTSYFGQHISASRLQHKSQYASSEPRPQKALHAHLCSFSEPYDHQEKQPSVACWIMRDTWSSWLPANSKKYEWSARSASPQPTCNWQITLA